MTEFTGTRPLGFTAPAWKNHPYQIHLLEQHGIAYGMCSLCLLLLGVCICLFLSYCRFETDQERVASLIRLPGHSFMHNDFHPYYVPYSDNKVVATDYRKNPPVWMVPTEEMRVSSIVEIPGKRPFY